MYIKGCTAPRAASHHSIYKVDGTIHAVEHHSRKLHLQQKLNGAQNHSDSASHLHRDRDGNTSHREAGRKAKPCQGDLVF